MPEAMDAAVRRDISNQEIQDFRSMVGPALQIALDLRLLTGLSEAEVIDLLWKDVEDDTISVRRGKSGQCVTIPLTPAICEVLLRARRWTPVTWPCWYVLRQSNGEGFGPIDFRVKWWRRMKAWQSAGGKLFFLRDVKRHFGS
jgi:integrase